MIILTKLDGTEFALNADLIETVEEKPDTTIRLTTKSYYIVNESLQDVVRKCVEFKYESQHYLRNLSAEQGREE